MFDPCITHQIQSALQHCKALFSLCLHRDTLACSGQGQVAGTMIKRLSQQMFAFVLHQMHACSEGLLGANRGGATT